MPIALSDNLFVKCLRHPLGQPQQPPSRLPTRHPLRIKRTSLRHELFDHAMPPPPPADDDRSALSTPQNSPPLHPSPSASTPPAKNNSQCDTVYLHVHTGKTSVGIPHPAPPHDIHGTHSPALAHPSTAPPSKNGCSASTSCPTAPRY